MNIGCIYRGSIIGWLLAIGTTSRGQRRTCCVVMWC